MPRSYYITKSGKLRRKDNTLYLENKDLKKSFPINDIESLYIFGEIGINTKLINYLSKYKIPLHFFNYYGFYTGSFYPREYLNSGMLLVKQVENFSDMEKRMVIVKEIIDAAVYNILKNLQHYKNQGKNVEQFMNMIATEKDKIKSCKNPGELMGIEGNARKLYYQSFEAFLRKGFEFEKRTRRPPENMLNCLISFGNSLLYTACLTEIYNSQLNPTISFLHEPFERRFSLALDLAEIFKPVIVDKVIFNLVNNQIIKEKHFDRKLNYCYLNDEGRKVFLKEFDERLRTTIQHKTLKRKVSYKHLIRLDCYKLVKHLIGDKELKAFRIWW